MPPCGRLKNYLTTAGPATRWELKGAGVRKTLRSTLDDWSMYDADEWPTLLTGNGLSINVWDGFSYSRPYDEASLSTTAVDVFHQLGTTNFETVLEALMHTEVVLDALGRSKSSVTALYRHVRESLFDTVRGVHVPWALLPRATLRVIGRVLDSHNKIFTTNYDLLPYWALMETPGVKIADYFWGGRNTFDPDQTEVFDGYSAMHYLHGGVHLWQSERTGQVGKWVSDGQGLLQLGTLYSKHSSRSPLFVSEATSRRKRRTIRRSEYLNFALDELRDDEENTVLFGSALGPQDEHVVLALRSGPRRRIAVSLRPAKAETILAAKGRYTEMLAGNDVVFFDATSHPLGEPALRVALP